jgi:multiple sugar transport system substrate-binding protein
MRTTKFDLKGIRVKTPQQLAPLAALGVAALALAGCTTGGGSSSAIGEPGATDISGTVTFWHAFSADSAEVKTLDDVLIPRFQDLYPDVEVEAVPVPYDELHQKLITAVAGDQLPDLVRADIIWVPQLADLGVLEPLSTSMPDFQEFADAVFPGPLATNRWQGEYYGLPLGTNTRVAMYNQDVFAAAGVEVPESFDDLLEVAPALKEAGAYAFADNGASGWNVLPWIWSAGGDIVDEDASVATGYLNSAESVAGIQALVDLYADEYLPPIILGDAGGLSTSDGLAQGAYATIYDGPWMYPIFAGQYPDFELKDAPVFAGDGGSISVVGGEDIVLTSSSQNKAAAAEFLRFLLSEEAQLEMAKVGQMPVRADLRDGLTSINPYYAQFVDQLATARPRPATPAWPEIDAMIQDEIRAAIRGEKTVQEALDAAAEQADELLAQYN